MLATIIKNCFWDISMVALWGSYKPDETITTKWKTQTQLSKS